MKSCITLLSTGSHSVPFHVMLVSLSFLNRVVSTFEIEIALLILSNNEKAVMCFWLNSIQIKTLKTF